MNQSIAVATLAGACLALAPQSLAQSFLGPSPYLSTADSPFDLSDLGTTTFLDDFEDGVFNLPGTHACGQVVNPSGITDSVDGDDGAIDGSGNGGHTFFIGDGPSGILVSFSELELGGLPKFAGLVWTDGGGGCSIAFEAFDQNGASLGTIEQDNVGDFSNSGTTAEDRFVGVEFKGGISAIHISNSTGGIEIDHIQFGGVPPQGPPPACYPDFTGDGALDLFDFLAFVNAFNAHDPAANCDNDCNQNLDLFDFLCYTNTFNAGC
jgi:hypothetical protein